MFFRVCVGTKPCIVGQMPIKGKKKKKRKEKKKLGHHIFRRITFILYLKELSVKINDSIYIFSDQNDCCGATESHHLLMAEC